MKPATEGVVGVLYIPSVIRDIDYRAGADGMLDGEIEWIAFPSLSGV